MDTGQARLLLGIEKEPLTRGTLRKARNDALKVHHPDLAGGDEEATLLATYWSAQVNAAFEFLSPAVADSRQKPRSRPSDAPRQSFAAAARRARRRAQHEQAAETERAR